MALFFYPDVADWQDRIRLGDGFSFTESALSGTYAASRITVEDPEGDANIVGHHAFRCIETACSWRTLFRGYFAGRDVGRNAEKGLLLGAAREWDCEVIDANAVLQFEVIRGTGAKRPAETDTQRLAWILGSSYKGPVLDDDTYVLGYDIDLDKADYTGQTMADVLADCGQASGANYFATYDDGLDGYVLHYYRPTRSFYSSGLRISNVLADVDGATTFAPDIGAKLNRNPERVWSGVLMTYGEKDSWVFEESSTILAAIGHRRETNEQNPSVRRRSRATAKAERYLEEGETELDTITCTVHKIPPQSVNLLRAGHRIQVRFSHLPGYESFTWMRVTRRTVQQDGETQGFYAITLELSDPKQVGARVRHPARPVEPEVEVGTTVSLRRAAVEASVERDDGHGGIPDEIGYTNDVPPGPQQILEAVTYSTTYIYGGCDAGYNQYNGLHHIEQWVEFDPGDLVGVAGIRFTYETSTYEGILGSLYSVFPNLEYGYMPADEGPPDSYNQGIVLGNCDAFGGSFVVPASMLTPDTTNYVFVRAGWRALGGGAICANYLVAGNLGPLGDAGTPGGGEFFSGALEFEGITATTVTVSGTGLIPWRSLEGAIDGSNRVFTLPDWNGKGTPRIAIGPVQYSAGSDFTYDSDAGTVTLNFAPWVGADLQGRWYI